ncbi:MAG TPA: hypothetical protein VHN36_19750 [Ilumatobacteraceae bacterium]|nr:hypothetical protein [Ilumatobacteraceae bacterium]
MSTDVNQWSYYPWVVKVPSVGHLGDAMNLLGEDGWELIASVTTVKSWLNMTGNDLVFVFKKAGAGHHPTAQMISRMAGIDPDAAVY